MPKTVSVKSLNGDMPLYDAEPDGAARGAVIVIQEAFGVNDHIEDVTRRFAAEGYRAVAPHLFHASGDPALGYDDISKVMPHMQAMTKDGLLADLEATLNYLGDKGFDQARIGITGFCMGGTVSFYAAVQYPLGAAVSFYGGGVASGRFGFSPQPELAPGLRTPWLGLYGDKDQSIPVDEVEDLRRAASGATVATEVVRYPEADHGFHCDARQSYHKQSATDAWRKALDWFSEHIAAG